ncbi:hypothetical protein SR41_04610 [Sphingomonas melonis]|uniref:Uncharacterized protein n=1 Tax=Sphingomonas melonis TaxID=152682 RepID=A0A0D1MA89_9SPHN|nr:hypothetical protein SR41_04610 [Sphingomonas melonis]
MSGARTAVADTATQKGLKPTANVAQQVRQQVGLSGAGGYAAEGDRAKQAAIEVMAGQPGMMNRLDDRLEGEDQAFKTFAEASLGSKTQPRQAVDEALSGEALTVARHVATGNIAGAVSSVLLRGNPRGTLRFKRDVQDRIAEIMTATRPADVSALLRAVADRAAQDDRFGAALARAGVTPAKIAALQAAGQDGDPVPLELDDGQVLLGFENNETTGHQDAPVYGKFGTHYPSSH